MGTGNSARIRRLECRIGQLSRGEWSWTYLRERERERERDAHSKCLTPIFRSLFAKVLGVVSRGNSAASLQRSPTNQTPTNRYRGIIVMRITNWIPTHPCRRPQKAKRLRLHWRFCPAIACRWYFKLSFWNERQRCSQRLLTFHSLAEQSHGR